MIPSLDTRSIITPNPALIPDLAVSITPSARKSFAHLYGEVKGGRLSYADLNAFAWWYGGGWLTVNRGRRGLARAHRGAEDVTRVRR